MKLAGFALISMVVLSACTTVTPDTITQHPTSARPQAVAVPAPASGTIFQAGAYRPMFEDHRARHVGDTLTVNITENSNANKESANASSKSGSVSGRIDTVLGARVSTMNGLAASAANNRQMTDKDTSSSRNNFNSTLTATVVDVLPNGNLVVAGEKQVALDMGIEYIRFSGVVNPIHISGGNSISSTQVADVRAEYRTSAQVDKSQVFSALARFFFSVLPL